MDTFGKKKKDYSKGRIYAIRNFVDNDVYIGSTTVPLSKRLSYHKSDVRKGKILTSIAKKMNELGCDNFYIELVEDYPCSNNEQLFRREGQIMRETPQCINILIAGRTRREHYEDNKEITDKKAKEQREQRKERIKEVGKKYREEHKEELKEKRDANKDYMKEYRIKYKEKNNDMLLEKARYYYRNNITRREKIECVCGSVCRKDNVRAHEKSQKHQQYLQSLF